jgi:hypothetical protein
LLFSCLTTDSLIGVVVKNVPFFVLSVCHIEKYFKMKVVELDEICIACWVNSQHLRDNLMLRKMKISVKFTQGLCRNSNLGGEPCGLALTN